VGELAELVSDHILRNVYGNMFAAIVDLKRQADHLGDNHGTTGPRLDDVITIARIGFPNLLEKMIVYIRAFLLTPHRLSSVFRKLRELREIRQFQKNWVPK
jgi:hypothetical protein